MAIERRCLSTFASNRSKGGWMWKVLLNLEFNMEDKAHFHILNKIIKKLVLIKKIWYGGNRTNCTWCGAPGLTQLRYCVLNKNKILRVLKPYFNICLTCVKLHSLTLFYFWGEETRMSYPSGFFWNISKTTY